MKRETVVKLKKGVLELGQAAWIISVITALFVVFEMESSAVVFGLVALLFAVVVGYYLLKYVVANLNGVPGDEIVPGHIQVVRGWWPRLEAIGFPAKLFRFRNSGYPYVTVSDLDRKNAVTLRIEDVAQFLSEAKLRGNLYSLVTIHLANVVETRRKYWNMLRGVQAIKLRIDGKEIKTARHAYHELETLEGLDTHFRETFGDEVAETMRCSSMTTTQIMEVLEHTRELRQQVGRRRKPDFR